MDFTKNLDLYLDPKLILEVDPTWGRYLAVFGFLLGLITAFILWYRSALRISELERQRDELKRGDIDIRPAIPKATVEQNLASVVEISSETKASEVVGAVQDSPSRVDDSVRSAVALPEDIPIKSAYSSKPSDADDLTLLEGIDSEKARELNRAGIYKFSQLKGLDEEDRRKIGFKFGWPNINWGSWEATAVGTDSLLGRESKSLIRKDYPESVSAIFDDPTASEHFDQEIRNAKIPISQADAIDLQLPSVYTTAPQDADDLTQLEGIDGEKAAELRRAGIYKFSQLADLDEEQRGRFCRKFKFPDLNWGKLAGLGGLGALGTSIGSLIQEGTEEEDAVDLQLPLVYTTAPEDADDLTQLEGIDEEKAAELRRAGIYKFSQLAELDEEQRGRVGRKFKFPDLNWDKLAGLGGLGALGTSLGSLIQEGTEEETNTGMKIPKVSSAEVGDALVSVGVPGDADDFTLLEGIDDERAAELHRAGVYKFSQLENLDEEQREKLSEKFKFNDINWGKWAGLAGLSAASGLGASLLRRDDGETEVSVPTRNAVAPENADDEITISPVKPIGGLSDETQKIQLPVLNGQESNSDWKWGYTFKERPDQVDDFTQLEGISAEDAARLNSEGVFTIKQLEDLSEEKREEVKSKFGWGDIDWGKWVAAPVMASGLAGVVQNDQVIPDLNVSAPPVDPATFTVVSPVGEAAKWPNEGARIKNLVAAVDTSAKFGELALTRDNFTRQIAEHFEGESIDVHPRYGIVYQNQPLKVDDLTIVKGIGPATEKRLNHCGVYRFKQIASWNAGAIEGFSNDLDLGTRIRDDEWISQATVLAGDESETFGLSDKKDYQSLIDSRYLGEGVDFKPGWGVYYTSPPVDGDDLTEIGGIGESTATKLNECGIYKFSQVAGWNEFNVASFNQRLGFSGRIEKDGWIAQAAKLIPSRIDSSQNVTLDAPPADSYVEIASNFKGEDVRVDPKLGLIFRSEPDRSDDLKLIWGIGNRISGNLNDHGIYRFSQIAGWNDYNVAEFDRKLNLSGRIERDQWISQAVILTKESEKLQKKFGSLLAGEFSGDPVTVKPGFGVVYTRIPRSVDDLTEINGIGPITEKQLNDVGIYTFKQIANWDDEAVEAVEREVNGHGRVGRDQWIRQAREFVQVTVVDDIVDSEKEPEKPGTMSYLETMDFFDGENVDIDENFGVVYTGRPTLQDDLKKIRGVGKFLETQLNERGVYRFKQIANWNAYNVWAFGRELAFPGRITREQWVSQASDFAELEDYKVEAEKLVKNQFVGESVKIDPELGIVYRKRPVKVDDLTQLPGIDLKVASRLNSDGIFTFDQVKNLKGAQRKFFTSRFGLGDIDWAKWSGVSALGAIGAGVVGIAKEIKENLIDSKIEPKVQGKLPEKISISSGVDALEADDLPTEEPKGIFGSAEDFERVFGGSAKPQDRRVVFIMDVSRSLTPAQLRLSKTELSAAVCALPEGSLYQVIFFSGPTWFAHQRMVVGGARGEDVVIADGNQKLGWTSGFGGFEFEGGNSNLPSGEWREANPASIAATLADISAVGKSYGTTWHLPLTMALNLNPVAKCIYFLTDGETARQDQVAEEMVNMARDRGGETQINTIALMVPGASVPLHRIAKGTGGEYSLVIAGGKVLKDDDLREYLSEKGIAFDD